MPFDVKTTQIYSSVTFHAAYAGLGNSTTFASNTVATGDINGDGFNDIFVAPWLWGQKAYPVVLIGDGTGKFTDATSQYFAPTTTFDVIKSTFIEDFNGDGKNDLMLFDTGSEAPSAWVDGRFPGGFNHYFIQGSSGFIDSSSSLVSNTFKSFNHTSYVYDMNGDGFADYLNVRFGDTMIESAGLVLAYNDGHGNFIDKTSLLPTDVKYVGGPGVISYDTTNLHYAGAVNANDFNGDGRADIVTGSYGQEWLSHKNAVRIWEQQANGTYVGKLIAEIPSELASLGINGVAGITSGDYDKDGDVDIALFWEKSSGGLAGVEVLNNNGNGTFTDVTISALGSYLVRGGSHIDSQGRFDSGITNVEFADFNNDGYLDLIFDQQDTRVNQYTVSADQKYGDNIYINDRAGHFTPWTPNLSSTSLLPLIDQNSDQWDSGIPVTFDVNNDGVMDTVFLDGQDGGTIDISTLLSIGFHTTNTTTVGQTLSINDVIQNIVNVNTGQVLVNSNNPNNVINLKGDGTHASGYAAYNCGDNGQDGTGEIVSITGKTKFTAVVHANEDTTINLTGVSDAFFAEDAFSSINTSLTKTQTTNGATAARVTGNFTVNAGAGDDVVDLTTTVSSLGSTINAMLNGGDGNDVLWGNAGDDNIFGGNGNDKLFGGQGENHLIGGAGNDVFQFAKLGQSTDYIDDFSIGDTLKMFGGQQSEVQVDFHNDSHSIDVTWFDHTIHLNVIGTMPTSADFITF